MSEWISVKDRLPDDNFGWYLIVTKEGGSTKVTMAFLDSCECGSCWLSHNDHDSPELEEVTHWMPLPEAPNE